MSQVTNDTTVFTCPMHPEVIRDTPGDCPVCGMALEPMIPPRDEEENAELVDMSRRLVVSVLLSIPIVVITMGDMIPGHPLENLAPPQTLQWLELILVTPVILWAGWPFFVRALVLVF